jgi:ABC-type lipoprotein export system ATPase subunit
MVKSLAEKMIECENLVKIYKTVDTEVLALQGLELTVDKGELMAIIGNSGSGKSTFLNMIGGLDRPSAGRLIVNGLDLFKLSEKELVAYKRDVVGFVWQNNARNLIPYLTALQNVQVPMMFGTEKERKARAEMLLELVGMSHRSGSRLNTLSGGEQQRVAIARAIAHKPRLLLADEPTAEVDSAMALQLMRLFLQLVANENIAMLMTTHDPSMMELGHHVYSLEDGAIQSEIHNDIDILEEGGNAK